MEHARLEPAPWKRVAIVFAYRALSRTPLGHFCSRSGSVLMVSSGLCIKSARRTRLSEAYAMDFVRRNTSIPVPKIYYAFERKGRVYILMQRVKGTYVGRQWKEYSPQSRQKILSQLKKMIEGLHSLQAPEGVGVASIDNKPILDYRLPAKVEWGPYSSIRDFHDALVDGRDHKAVTNPEYAQLQRLGEFYDQPWPRAVFTHGDLSSLNILCSGDDVVGIVDWETSGWLPPYWEYVTAWYVNPHNTFWQQEVDHFLVPWPKAKTMDETRRKYFGLF